MAALAEKHTSRLDELKQYAEEYHTYFKENIDRFHKFMRFVFKTGLTAAEAGALQSIDKPTIEFNFLEAFVSRLRGEFATQQPSIRVRAADGVPLQNINLQFEETLELIEAYMRYVFFDGDNDMMQYDVYTDLLGGGFSALLVYTDYSSQKSFDQNIYVKKVSDPTLTFFDTMAQESHKGDGRFCGQIHAFTEAEFKEKFGAKAAEKMSFTKTLGGFNWSYKSGKEKIILVADFYEKVQTKTKIHKLTNGSVVTDEEYEKAKEYYSNSLVMEQLPLIMDTRTTHIQSIVRYQFCETEVLTFQKTNYGFLPIIFVDGNSVLVKDGGYTQQVTRPSTYHAEGIQRLTTFAGQSLANELENLVQHKFVVALESIPENYQSAYKNIQKADTLVYHHFYDENNPDSILPPPREIQRPPIPAEIARTFMSGSAMAQTILGSYDAALGINDNNLSGKAIEKGSLQSNSASMPYLVGYTKGMNRCAQIILNLMPKYLITPRTLPVVKSDGSRSFETINHGQGVFMNFDPDDLEVRVDIGVNFEIQKEIAMNTIIRLMHESQNFRQFMEADGLEVLLDNISIRGADVLKAKVKKYLEKQAMQQAQQQQVQQQAIMDDMLERKKQLHSPTKEQVAQYKANIDAAKVKGDLENDKAKTDIDFIKTMSTIRSDAITNEIRQAELDAENVRSAVDLATKIPGIIPRSEE